MRNETRPKIKTNFIFLGDRWDNTWRRRQQFAYRLAKMPEVNQVIYVELPLSMTSFLRFLIGQADADASIRWRRVLKRGLISKIDGIKVVTPISILPIFCYNKISLFNEWLLTRLTKLLLKRKLSRKETRSSFLILWLSHPFGGEFVGRFSESFVCYDCTEKFALYEGWDRKFLEEVRKRDIAIASKADLILTQTKSHCEEKQRINPNTYLSPNAVDCDLFESNSEKFDFSRYGITIKPIIGFVGNMSWRIDYRLLHSLATTHPEWSLVFVSPLSDKSLIKDLKKLPNVYFLGSRSYFNIPQLIRAFDVCIIPYKNTGVENSPIKLFDYLASGKPIVTTRIPGVMDFADVVYIANSEEDFSKKVEQALKEPPTLAERRLARARENSWDVRVKEVWEMIMNKLDSRI